MNQDLLTRAARDCLQWMQAQMLTFNRGTWGIYERIRIDENLRVCWTRPDCAAETARAMLLYERVTGSTAYADIAANLTDWLLLVQDTNPSSAWYGSFPFYLLDGYAENGGIGQTRYQNDNGKILLCLNELYAVTGDERVLSASVRLADYWVGIQTADGVFFRADGKTNARYKSPCFILWLMAGMAACYAYTGEQKYLNSAKNAMTYVLGLQTQSGRFRTSYEIHQAENWRPVSSENAIAVYCLSVCRRLVPDLVPVEPLTQVLDYVLSLCDKSGAVVNCGDADRGASEQEDQTLCDLVYTQGYALMGLIDASRVLDRPDALRAAENLAAFLIRIQCREESPLWDGAWRGSYDIAQKRWRGRADQHNALDEGGMYSVYTGWCAAPILTGLMMIGEG